MTEVLLDMEFPSGKGTQVEKSWKFQGMGAVL